MPKRMPILSIAIRHFVASSSAKLCSCAGKSDLFCLRYFPPTGTAKYAVNTPVAGSTALPVISPLSFMSFASARTAE